MNLALRPEWTGLRRVERSALAPEAQPYQDFIDRLLYAMAGITDDEARGLAAAFEEVGKRMGHPGLAP